MNRILKIGICLFFFQILIILIKPYLFPIQLFLTNFVSKLMNLDHSGIELYINEYTLEIEPLCTGVLMYFTLISLFFAFFDIRRAVLYSLVSFLIVFFLNLVRILATCFFIKNYGDIGILFHDIYWISDGIFTFIIFYIFYRIDDKIKDR